MLQSNMLTKEQMLEQYHVLGFFYDLCIVQRLSDGVKGTLQFANHQIGDTYTRYYYNFVEE